MILTRDSEDMKELQLCVQWILFAKRPLKQEEYFFAIRSPESLEATNCWLSGDVSADDMHRFVHSSSKGLAQVTKTRSKDKTPTVQFIHESVRDFFLLKNGYLRLWPNLSDQFATHSHETLKTRCIAEINGSNGNSTLASLLRIMTKPPPKDFWKKSIESLNGSLTGARSSEATSLRRSLPSKFPFLEYAVHNVLYHADAADSDPATQEKFLKDFPLKYWIYLDNIFQIHQIRRHTLNASLLYILAENNLPRLIKHQLKHVPIMDIRGERYQFPLVAAAANGNREAITALLMRENKSQSDRNLASQFDFLREIKHPQIQTPLSYAAGKGNEVVVKLLLDTGKVDVEAKDNYGLTPLLLAAKNGHAAVMKLLLDSGNANIESKSNAQIPLSWAARDGHEAVVKLLLETGKVDVNSKSGTGQTPLSQATENGHEAIVKLLLNNSKVDVDSKDNGGRTPLLWAAILGHKAIVKLLLKTGKVDVNLEDTTNYGKSPLSWAAEHGHVAVVKLLLGADKVKVELKDSKGQTPLSRAAMNGHEAIVKLLLKTGKVNPNSKNEIGRTPLSLAATNGHENMVKLLLNTGKVDVESMDNSRQTPLFLAAIFGHDVIVKLLLNTGKVDVNRKNFQGWTALSWAAMRGYEAVVKLLLGSGKVDIKLKNGDGRTPLSLAANNGHDAVVKLLLEAGTVDVESEDDDRRTSSTAMDGHEAVVKMLQSYISHS